MKKYTFTLPKNNDTAKIYKEALMNRVINAYPWLTVESSTDYPYSTNGIKYAKASDYITLGMSNKFDISWFPKEEIIIPSNYIDVVNYNLETEFFKAINALDTYAKLHSPKYFDYDFKDIFGTPVKIFDNFVQIGYEIIPIVTGSLNHLKPNTKKTIIEITINLKKRGLF